MRHHQPARGSKQQQRASAIRRANHPIRLDDAPRGRPVSASKPSDDPPWIRFDRYFPPRW